MAVEVGSIIFYEKLIITDVGEGKSKYEVDRTSPARDDGYAKEFIGKAKEKFILRPLGDRVVVEHLSDDDKVTSGGIVIPDSAKERPQRGKIVAVGPGKKLDDGGRAKMDVEVGDLVYHSKYAGSELKVSGVEYLILREEDIIGVVED